MSSGRLFSAGSCSPSCNFRRSRRSSPRHFCFSSPGRGPRASAPTGSRISSVGGALAVVVAQVARGRSLNALLGAYAVVGEQSYDVGKALRYLAYHLAELDLYLGRDPRCRSRRPRRPVTIARPPVAGVPRGDARPHGMVCRGRCDVRAPVCRSHPGAEPVRRRAAVVVLLLRRSSAALHDRAASHLRLRRVGAPDPRDPVETYITTSSVSDTLVLCPGGPSSASSASIWWPARAPALCGVRGGLAFVRAAMPWRCRWSCSRTGSWRSSRSGLAPIPTASGRPGPVRSFRESVASRDWIDRSVPSRLGRSVLWTGHSDRFTVNVNEFFNRRVGRATTRAPRHRVGSPRFPSRSTSGPVYGPRQPLRLSGLHTS